MDKKNGMSKKKKGKKKLIAILAALLLSNITMTSTTAVASPTTVCTTNMTGCNWSGLYVGGFAGGATGTRITTTEPLRLDNNAFWFRPFHNSFTFKTKPSFMGGITLGFNLPICDSPFLVGLEGEYGYLNLRGRSTDPNQFPYAALPNNNLQNASQNVVKIGKSSGYGLVGARLIYAGEEFVVFYIKSGAVFTKIQSKYDSVKTESLAPVFLNLAGKKNIAGYAIGGGIEYALPFECFSNVSTKIEYLFMGFNHKKYVYGHCSCHFLWRMQEHIRGVNTIKVGINYKFK